MALYVLAITLLLLEMLAVFVVKAFKELPLKELKRRAVRGNATAASLYSVASYGQYAFAPLWLLIILSSSSLFLTLNELWNGLVAYLITAASLAIVFMLSPPKPIARFVQLIAARFGRVLSSIAGFIYPVAKRFRFLLKSPVYIHTGVFETEDLVALIRRQKKQADNSIRTEELELAEHALVFSRKQVGEVMTPWRVVYRVNADEAISMQLLDELHKEGHSRYPVFENEDKSQIAGVLYVKKLIGIKESGTVRTYMDPHVFYIHEEQTLLEALNAFLRTEHHLFIVVNTFEEMIGILTIEDVLEQLIGRQIVDEFDQYESMRAVASIVADKQHQEHIGDGSTSEKEEKIVE